MIIFEGEVLCYVVVVVVNEEDIIYSGVVEELEVAQYLFKFYSYYSGFVCSRFQARLVIVSSVLVGTE